MARPSKKLDERQIAQVEALASCLTMEQIADYFGICRKTFHTICQRQPDVFTHYKKGRSRIITNIGKSLINKALAGDVTSMIFYLKTQAGWKETSVNEITGVDGEAIKVEASKQLDFSEMSDEEVRQFIALGHKASGNIPR